MDFKVDYIALYDVADALIQNYENLTTEFNDLLKIADDIKSSWDGPDYLNFKNKLVEYIKGINVITQDIKYIGDNMKLASRSYEFKDSSWKKDIDSLEKDESRYE